MFYHGLGEVNQVIYEMNNACASAGIQLMVRGKENYFEYEYSDSLNENVVCGGGIIYEYKNHGGVKRFVKVDEIIDIEDRMNLNYIKSGGFKYGELVTRNWDICDECKLERRFYVNMTSDYLDTFCLHSDYIKDEVNILVDE